MITIFFGEDLTKSRSAFLEAKKQESESLSLEGSKLTLPDLIQAIEGQGLFENKQSVFIEELLSKKKQSKELESLTTYLNNHESSEIFLWESKELTKKQLQLFPKAKTQQFALPKILFTFLESIRPGNTQQLISLFHNLSDTQEEELLFFMIVRQFRMLLAIIEPSEKNIDEIKRIAPWQQGKLIKQANLFGKERLRTFYQQLYAIEEAMKTGQLTQPLGATVDFFLLQI